MSPAKGASASPSWYGPSLTQPGALDLLDAWLDVHPERSVERMVKLQGRFHIHLRAGTTEFRSYTQETLESAIRTVLGIAWMESER